MSIEAKTEGFIRLIGSILILISLFLLVMWDILIINCFSDIIIFLAVVISWISFISLIKLEKELVIENLKGFGAFLTFFTLGLIIIGFFSCAPGFLVAMINLSYIGVAICWRYALSIYKKQKIVYLIAGGGVILLRIPSFLPVIIPLLIFIIAFLAVLIAERRMKKKGMLNYI